MASASITLVTSHLFSGVVRYADAPGGNAHPLREKPGCLGGKTKSLSADEPLIAAAGEATRWSRQPRLPTTIQPAIGSGVPGALTTALFHSGHCCLSGG